MDPKEKKVKEEELNVEETHNPAEDQPQNEQAEGTAPLTHEEELEKELEKVQQIARVAGLQSTSLVWNTAYKGIDDWQLALRQEEAKEKAA